MSASILVIALLFSVRNWTSLVGADAADPQSGGNAARGGFCVCAPARVASPTTSTAEGPSQRQQWDTRESASAASPVLGFDALAGFGMGPFLPAGGAHRTPLSRPRSAAPVGSRFLGWVSGRTAR